MGVKPWAWKSKHETKWTRFFFTLRDAKAHQKKNGGYIGKRTGTFEERIKTKSYYDQWVEYRRK